MNADRIINPDVIDWEKYSKKPAEAALIRDSSHWMGEVYERFRDGLQITGIKLPWQKTWQNIRLRPGEVSIWGGINGSGKSLLLGQVMLSAICQAQQKCCIASLEMLPASTLYRITRQAIGPKAPTQHEVEDFLSAFAVDKLYIYDQQGVVTSDRILALARYCHAELGINHFVIDSMMKCGIGVDNYNRQKDFIDELCSLARDTGMHIHLVAHSRKGRSEHEPIGKFDIKGASEITDQVDNVFLVWRNKPKEDGEQTAERADVILRCCKQRHFEWEGAVRLWFDKRTMQYHEEENYTTKHYIAALAGGC